MKEGLLQRGSGKNVVTHAKDRTINTGLRVAEKSTILTVPATLGAVALTSLTLGGAVPLLALDIGGSIAAGKIRKGREKKGMEMKMHGPEQSVRKEGGIIFRLKDVLKAA